MRSYYLARRAKLLKRRLARRLWRRPIRSPFMLRRWFALHAGPLGFEGRRTWFNRRAAERREFQIYYGYNPRCRWRGLWTGDAAWQRYRA